MPLLDAFMAGFLTTYTTQNKAKPNIEEIFKQIDENVDFKKAAFIQKAVANAKNKNIPEEERIDEVTEVIENIHLSTKKFMEISQNLNEKDKMKLKGRDFFIIGVFNGLDPKADMSTEVYEMNACAENYGLDKYPQMLLEKFKQLDADKKIEAPKLSPNVYDCSICMCEIEADLFKLPGCVHKYHKECMASYLANEINENKLPIFCPDCKFPVMTPEVKRCLSDPKHTELVQKYEKFVVKLHESKNPTEFAQCLTPDCISYQKKDGKEIIRLDCAICNTSYCLSCKVLFHLNMDCKTYQEEKKRNEELKKQESENEQAFLALMAKDSKQCPKCKVWINRSAGCKAMKCTKCMQLFCYNCLSLGDGHKCPCNGGNYWI